MGTSSFTSIPCDEVVKICDDTMERIRASNEQHREEEIQRRMRPRVQQSWFRWLLRKPLYVTTLSREEVVEEMQSEEDPVFWDESVWNAFHRRCGVQYRHAKNLKSLAEFGQQLQHTTGNPVPINLSADDFATLNGTRV